MGSRDLLQIPLLRKLITARWPQLIVRSIALGVFILVILAGLFGTPVGNQNLSIALIWIAWWAVLILILVPFLGRSWCSVCPLPLPREWLQQGTVLGPQIGKKAGEKDCIGRENRGIFGSKMEPLL
jgi:polyferredoxin